MASIAYCRKSSESDDRQALSLEAQEMEAESLAKRHGIEISKTFSEAKSAKTPLGRPLFAEMMAMLYGGEADTIVTWKLDRLARNPVDGGAINWALQQGIIKRIVTPERTYLPEDNVLMMMLEFGMANQYIIDLRRNVLRGMRLKAEKGGWNHRAPFGYRNAMGKVEKDPEREIWVRRMFELRVQGKNFKEIADSLNSLSVKAPKGGEWGKSGVERTIKNRFYIGAVRFQGEIMEGNHGPIIPKSLWKAAQEVGARFQGRHDHAFRGLLTCGECGCAITSEEQKGHIYYRCTKRKGECSQRYVREEGLAKGFRELLETHRKPAFFDEIKAAWGDSDLVSLAIREKAVDSINRRIASLERERLGNIRMRRDEEIDAEMYKSVEKDLSDKILSLNVELGNMAKLNEANIRKGMDALELLGRLDLSLKAVTYGNLARFLKRLGSNYTLKDGKPQAQAVSEGLGLLFFGDCTVWSSKRDTARTYFMGVLANLQALFNAFGELGMA